MATFEERLQQLRDEKGLTQSLLAREMGVASGTVSVWERGVRKPTNETLYIMSEYFMVPMEYLLGVSDDRTLMHLTDEEIAEAVLEEEREIGEHMLERYLDLSPEMQKVVRLMVNDVYRVDEERGMLQSQQHD